jgi:hypothetical protein
MLWKVHIQGDKLFVTPSFQFAAVLLVHSNSDCCELQYLTSWQAAISEILVVSWWLLIYGLHSNLRQCVMEGQ